MINSVKNAVSIIDILVGNEVTGLRNKEISEATGLSAATIFHHLQTLEELGIAEQIPKLEGRWRLGPRFIQFALAHERHMTTVQGELDQVRQRCSRIPSKGK